MASLYSNDPDYREYGNLPRNWHNQASDANNDQDGGTEAVSGSIYANASVDGVNNFPTENGEEQNRIERESTSYLTPVNTQREVVSQRALASPSPRSRRKKARSRYDENLYALPDLPEDYSSQDSSEELEPDATKSKRGEFCIMRVKIYCILIVVLVIGVGGGFPVALIFLRETGNTISS